MKTTQCASGILKKRTALQDIQYKYCPEFQQVNLCKFRNFDLDSPTVTYFENITPIVMMSVVQEQNILMPNHCNVMTSEAFSFVDGK